MTTSIIDHVTGESLASMAKDLRGTKIFITGGAGFIGTWILESILWLNQHCGCDIKTTVLTRRIASRRLEARCAGGKLGLDLVTGDVRNFDFPSGGFDYVIHAAADTNPGIDPRETLDVTINGTKRALDFAADRHVRGFLMLSSGAVYNRMRAPCNVQESYGGAPDLGDPASACGEGKRVAELLCRIYMENGTMCKIARLFAFVGPYMKFDGHFAIGNFIDDAAHGRPITVEGDGESVRSYLYAADLVVWLWTILLRGSPCLPYNVGSSRAITMRELADTIGAIAGLPVLASCDDRPFEKTKYVPCVTRAELLGLHQTVPLEDAIRRTLEWRRAVEWRRAAL